MTTEKNDLLTYDEDDAVKFIRKNNPSLALDDNQINYIIDLVYDYYESRGLLDEDKEESVEIADDELIEYVIASARKEKIYTLSDEDIAAVVEFKTDENKTSFHHGAAFYLRLACCRLRRCGQEKRPDASPRLACHDSRRAYCLADPHSRNESSCA